MTDAEYTKIRSRLTRAMDEQLRLAAKFDDINGYCGGEAAGLRLALYILALTCDRFEDAIDTAVPDTVRREP